MKKLIVCAAGSALLAACGQGNDEAVTEVAVEEEVPADTREDYFGAWNVSYPDGTSGVTTNNEDGTYVAEREDGTTITGTWTFGDNQSCWTPDEGDTGGCYEISPPQFDNSRVLTAEDGSVMIVAPITEAAADAASEEGAAEVE